MGLRIAFALSASALAVLVLGAVMRAMARRGSGKPIRQAGGAVLFVAAPIGLLFAATVPTRALVLTACALAVGAFGVVRDRMSVPKWATGVVLVGTAAVATATGVRFPMGGVPLVDAGWTVAWITVVTAAVANSGNADGQFPGLAGASSLAVVALAGFAFQSAAATLAAALLGALLGFLAYNLRPASLYPGRSGTYFAGFLIAVGAIWVRPSIGRPESLLVSVLIVGVALLDITFVTWSRLRRGRPLSVRLRDHLAHRLVAAGLRPSSAIWLLAGVQLALSGIAVFVGRGVLSVPAGAVAAVVLLGALAIAALRARMRSEEAPGLSWRVRLAIGATVVFVIAASAVALVSAVTTRTELLAAREKAQAAVEAARNGDSARAVQLFTEAEQGFSNADDRLGSIVNVPSLVVPVVGSNVHAARELTRVGLQLSRAGRQLTEEINSDDLRLVDGRVPLESVARIAPDLDAAASVLRSSDASMRRLNRSFLLGPLAKGVRELRAELGPAAGDATRAATVSRVAPAVLGGSDPRHYLLVVQNPAEQRGTGGLVGNYGELTASDGEVDLGELRRTLTINAAPVAKKLHASKEYVDRYGRFEPTKSFQNANITADFPSAAGVMADIYEQVGNPDVDGVLAVDPLGLAALLELTGPVRVEGWPTPISADNVVDVTLRQAYAVFPETPDRVDFLGQVARKVIDRATEGDLGSMDRLSKVLGQAAREGHFAVWFKDSELQRTVEEIGVGGKLPPPKGDSILVSNSNASATKLDLYTTKSIDYSVTVAPSDDLRKAALAGTLRVEYANNAPAGLPQYVAGPYEGRPDDFVYGQNRTFLSVYSPLGYTGARVGDRSVGMEVAPELGYNVFSTFLDVFAGESQTFELDLTGVVPLERRGWYELQLVRQPAIEPDAVSVRIAVPEGYRIVDSRGIPVENGVAQGTIDLAQTRTVAVKIAPDSGAGLWQRLRSGS